MNLSSQRQGELLVISGVVFWSLFPIFAKISYSNVSPFTSLWVSLIFASLYFSFIVTYRRKWNEILNKQAVKYSLYSAFFTGVIFYLFYFLSLRYSSPGNVSILALSEAFFSFLLFHVWHKEHFPKIHIYGALLILSGAAIVLVPSMTSFKFGDLLILIATAIVPFGNFYVQKAKKFASTEVILFIRGLAGALAIFILSFVFNEASSVKNIVSSIPYLFANGLLILGVSTNLWIKGISKIPVTKATALNALGPLLTIFFAFMIFKTPPTSWQMAAFVPMFFGMILISYKS